MDKIEKVKNDIEKFLKDSIEHQNKHIDYVLYDPNNDNTYALASDGYDEAIEFTPFTKEYEEGYINVPGWDYNFDYYIYNYLEEGKKIGYMTDEVHYSIWNSINDLYPKDIDYKDGVQEYLQYCADNGITKEYLDNKIGFNTPDIMHHFEGLAINNTMKYKGYIIKAGELNPDNSEENFVHIYGGEKDFSNGNEICKISLGTIGLRQNIRNYIDEFYVDKSVTDEEKSYFTFVLGYDLLNDILIKSSAPENDISYDFCRMIAKEFLNSKEYTNEKNSSYELLEKWVNENIDFIKAEYSKFKGNESSTIDDISIIETKDTKYYRLDWNYPHGDYKAVYLAIRGEISSNPSLCLFSTSGVGYNWTATENHKFFSISRDRFKEDATLKNIVYFIDKDGRYNDLLNYPNEYQKYIDTCLLEEGYKPHGKVSLKEQLKIIRNKKESEKKYEKIEKSRNERSM